MKLDATDLRYISADEFRVLTAVSRLTYCLTLDSRGADSATG